MEEIIGKVIATFRLKMNGIEIYRQVTGQTVKRTVNVKCSIHIGIG